MSSQKAIAFAAQARSVAEYLEMAYRVSVRLKEYWDAAQMANDIPFNTDPLEDGNLVQPITNQDIYGIMYRCDELKTGYEADNNADLFTILKMSNLPIDWR